MSKNFSFFAALMLAATAFAPAAIAENAEDKASSENIQLAMVEAEDMTSETTEARVIAIPVETETEVLSTTESNDLIPVQGPDGRIYYNRIIPVSELPDPDLDIRVLDTYTVNYEGEVYTNKIVQEID